MLMLALLPPLMFVAGWSFARFQARRQAAVSDTNQAIAALVVQHVTTLVRSVVADLSEVVSDRWLDLASLSEPELFSLLDDWKARRTAAGTWAPSSATAARAVYARWSELQRHG